MNFLFSLSKYSSWPTVLLIEKTMRDRLYCQCCILIKVYQWVTADAVLVQPLIQTMTQYPILISTMMQRTEALDLWPFRISTRHFLNQLMEQTSLFPRPRRSERPNKGTKISLHKVIVLRLSVFSHNLMVLSDAASLSRTSLKQGCAAEVLKSRLLILPLGCTL